MKNKNLKHCLYCDKIIKNRQNIFCNNKCFQDFTKDEYIKKWKENENDEKYQTYQISSTIKKYLLEKNNYKCQKCGWGEKNVFTGRLPLEIHHVDGDHKNNKEDNLEVLCPNCHSLTENYKAANKNGRKERDKYIKNKYCMDCGTLICNTSNRCQKCEHERRKQLHKMPITREELKSKIYEESFCSIGRQFNVSANSIKKWCKKYSLPHTKKEIESYSKEEWLKL